MTGDYRYRHVLLVCFLRDRLERAIDRVVTQKSHVLLISWFSSALFTKEALSKKFRRALVHKKRLDLHLFHLSRAQNTGETLPTFLESSSS